MKTITNILLALVSVLSFSCSTSGQINFNKALNDANKDLNQLEKGNKPLTNDEVVQGLREALNVGTNNSTASASKVDGFYKNPLVFIPFPPEAEKIKNTVEGLGMKKQVQDFEMRDRKS